MIKKLILTFVLGWMVISHGYTISTNDEETKDNSNITLSGQVIDSQSQEALSGAAVKLDGLNHTVYTDFDGYFIFENLIPGKYDITITYPAYKDKKITKLQVGKSDIQDVTIKLGSIK